jgi:hypothetical protein
MADKDRPEDQKGRASTIVSCKSKIEYRISQYTCCKGGAYAIISSRFPRQINFGLD